MTINPALFSSNSDLWGTPQYLFDSLNEEFHFTLDVCATPLNAKCERYFTPEVDALTQEWSPNICWMNPPYSRNLGLWIRKAYIESLYGATVVCLVPSRTDTKWFHDYCTKGDIRFIKGRLKFGDSKNSAPFPSMIVIFKEHYLV